MADDPPREWEPSLHAEDEVYRSIKTFLLDGMTVNSTVNTNVSNYYAAVAGYSENSIYTVLLEDIDTVLKLGGWDPVINEGGDRRGFQREPNARVLRDDIQVVVNQHWIDDQVIDSQYSEVDDEEEEEEEEESLSKKQK
jgi:hypothetical protein